MVDENEGEDERDIGGLTTTALAVGGFPRGYEKPPGSRSTAVNGFAPLACNDEGWPDGMLDTGRSVKSLKCCRLAGAR